MRLIPRALMVFIFCLLWSALLPFPHNAAAEESGAAWVSRLVSVQGQAFVKRAGQSEWQTVSNEETFFPGDAFRVAADSRAAIVLVNESVLRIDQYTTLVFSGIEKEKTFLMELLEGAAFFFSRKARSLKVVTPFVNGVVEGTEFYVQVDADRTTIILYEGAVLAENRRGDLTLAKGQAAVAAKDRAPRLETIVRPRDAVQWALYYPPVLAVQPEGASQREGDTGFHVNRAASNLSVGRVDGAAKDIEQALGLDDRNSPAMALRSVMAVVQNRKADALKDARAAVEMDGRSTAARIALSYALQAHFDIEAAADAAETATQLDKQNSLAWARLAELRLSLGDTKGALQAANKAAALSPELAHVQTVLGYAYLTRIKTDEALEAFDRAITLDNAAPLPRLGSGLAKIRNGDLAAGRADIEIAAGLDPDNSLIRSYLGKAYFDEKRDPLDERQFEMAKQLDPNDPTPWFYEAIRKQTVNRPGEALLDMQKAIELNDNRAVYRSRLLLDEDQAARSASLGRIYNDLSFQEQALRQGWKSLEADPANYSAHRLLADMYASRPRHEIARVSELLQSQLLQPLNVTPVQPQLAESNLLILEGAGPGSLGFNEFNPLYMRDRDTVQASAVLGENKTVGGDATVAGLHQWLSYSVGAFRYETDGFRENNDLTKDIYNVFVQAALTPKQSIQFEYRYKETDRGDLGMYFDPDSYSENLREEREEHIPRIGYHYEINPNHDVIASFIWGSKKRKYSESTEIGFIGPFPIVFSQEDDTDSDSYTAEAQYLYHRNRLSMVVGAGYFDEQAEGISNTSLTAIPIPPTINSNNIDENVRYANAYTYFETSLWEKIGVVLGASADKYDYKLVEVDQINPKFGITYSATHRLGFRAAVFRTLTRPWVSNQTIEPTQVAGFNQFFEDPAGTDAWRYAGGVDYRVTNKISIGGEFTLRDLEVPTTTTTGAGQVVVDEEMDEMLHRVYLYYLPHPRVSISSEYLFEYFAADTEDPDLAKPKKLRTQQVPIAISYFDPDGWYAKVVGRYVQQNIEEFSSTGGTIEDDESFTLFDFTLGYRLPKRFGTLSLSVTNLFDKEFRYYNLLLPADREQAPIFLPQRELLLKMSVAF